ncbi:MAG TPA: helix-turn-helix transcriptional regulator [Acidimicrobiales bacterium]|nr:helix-turn-helix transcriptional regulator [Acidimicrobiales bacterium]
MSGTSKGKTPRQRELGRRIREMRDDRSMSQEALALSADVHRTYIAQLESGMRNPSLETTAKLALALGVDVADLVGGLQSWPGRE